MDAGAEDPEVVAELAPVGTLLALPVADVLSELLVAKELVAMLDVVFPEEAEGEDTTASSNLIAKGHSKDADCEKSAHVYMA